MGCSFGLPFLAENVRKSILAFESDNAEFWNSGFLSRPLPLHSGRISAFDDASFIYFCRTQKHDSPSSAVAQCSLLTWAIWYRWNTETESSCLQKGQPISGLFCFFLCLFCVRVRVRVFMCVCASACVRVHRCVCACACACLCVLLHKLGTLKVCSFNSLSRPIVQKKRLIRGNPKMYAHLLSNSS